MFHTDFQNRPAIQSGEAAEWCRTVPEGNVTPESNFFEL